MKFTISILLETLNEQDLQLLKLQTEYHKVCNQIVLTVIENRCWNRVALHHLVYNKVRKTSPLGSQMVCNAIFSVCKAYKAKGIRKDKTVPVIQFRKYRSVHFDHRTYSIKGNILSLYTLQGRIRIPMRKGSFQEKYFSQGTPKEAELINRKGKWYFNLVLELPDPHRSEKTKMIGVDIGENVLAVTSMGNLYGGGKVRHERIQYFAKRRRLQSNGTQSSKQLLKKISGKEERRMKHINHEVSKRVIQEAIKEEAGIIVLEDLTHIRARIKAGKKMRSRLHRWGFRQLQAFIHYKAESQGLQVMYVNPAYSSQECSQCGCLGVRQGHHFKCLCGHQQHSDLNASRNLCRFAQSLGRAMCAVNRTQVAAL
ncbi:MAG: IS200/IS605 family accessory protein TnpB-related protein [Verrucomicrobia bacterium]|nr:IS200/IS605 family accessory protein TnpB-related protein [Verrucomicrobiota bacterium]